MRCETSAASIIDVRDMMIGMAINISMTDRQTHRTFALRSIAAGELGRSRRHRKEWS
ncbi:MAG: hypothetical protein WC198_04390 [Victivallaceae bacterium]